MKHAVRNIHCRPHLCAATELLRSLGAEGIEARSNGHIRLSWQLGGVPMQIHVPSSPRSDGNAVRYALQAVRRTLREHGFADEVRA